MLSIIQSQSPNMLALGQWPFSSPCRAFMTSYQNPHHAPQNITTSLAAQPSPPAVGHLQLWPNSFSSVPSKSVAHPFLSWQPHEPNSRLTGTVAERKSDHDRGEEPQDTRIRGKSPGDLSVAIYQPEPSPSLSLCCSVAFSSELPPRQATSRCSARGHRGPLPLHGANSGGI